MFVSRRELTQKTLGSRKTSSLKSAIPTCLITYGASALRFAREIRKTGGIPPTAKS